MQLHSWGSQHSACFWRVWGSRSFRLSAVPETMLSAESASPFEACLVSSNLLCRAFHSVIPEVLTSLETGVQSRVSLASQKMEASSDCDSQIRCASLRQTLNQLPDLCGSLPVVSRNQLAHTCIRCTWGSISIHQFSYFILDKRAWRNRYVPRRGG